MWKSAPPSCGWFNSGHQPKLPKENVLLLRVTATITRNNNNSLKFRSKSVIGDFMWASRSRVHGERKTMRVSNNHELRTFAAPGLFNSWPPFFNPIFLFCLTILIFYVVSDFNRLSHLWGTGLHFHYWILIMYNWMRAGIISMWLVLFTGFTWLMMVSVSSPILISTSP